MPTLPEPSSAAVVLDTDVASRSFKGLLPPRLAARLAPPDRYLPAGRCAANGCGTPVRPSVHAT
jgi:hypothetical protein